MAPLSLLFLVYFQISSVLSQLARPFGTSSERLGMTSTSLGDNLALFIGGHNSSLTRLTRNVDYFNLRTNRWNSAALALQLNKVFLRSFTVANFVFVFDGINQSQALVI